MKILFLSYSFEPNVGGIESHSMILATELVKAGYELCLLTMTEGEGRENYSFRVVRKPGFWDKMKWHRWADLVFENNPVVNLSIPNALIRRPRVTTLHTWIHQPGGPLTLSARFKYWWLEKAGMVITVSKALQTNITGEANVIPNPYKDDLFYRYQNIEKTKSFVFLGRLVSDKGLHIALEAVKISLQSSLLSAGEKQAIQLTVIGDGPEKAQLVQRAQTLGIADQVDFTGVLKGEELAQVLNEHQFALIPSLWEEPFGMVALEAMACGCIPLASHTGGLPEAIGEAGLLFEKGNSQELAQQMIRLFQDRLLQQQLRINAQSHLARHTAAIIAKQYINCIEIIARQNKLPSPRKTEMPLHP